MFCFFQKTTLGSLGKKTCLFVFSSVFLLFFRVCAIAAYYLKGPSFPFFLLLLFSLSKFWQATWLMVIETHGDNPLPQFRFFLSPLFFLFLFVFKKPHRDWTTPSHQWDTAQHRQVILQVNIAYKLFGNKHLHLGGSISDLHFLRSHKETNS